MIQADSVKSMYEKMKEKLNKFVPEAEMKIKAEIAFEINQLKKEKNAVMLQQPIKILLFFVVCVLWVKRQKF